MALETSDKIKVMLAYTSGEEVQKLNIRSAEGPKRWSIDRNPEWDWRTYDYRIAVPAPRHHEIDWSHVAEGFDWLYTMSGDVNLLSNVKPKKDSYGFYLDADEFKDALAVSVKGLASFKAGNMPWDKSLVERPKQP